MHAFGFLSFGHYGHGSGPGDPDAGQALRDAVEIGVGADEIGVNGAYFRVHHFARQGAAPMPVLSAIAARTRHIEVGTGVIDMRYETPLQLAEEAAALDLISGGRVALGVSRGSPEPALRGWEAFGHTGARDPRGADLAREHFDLFWRAIGGEGIAETDVPGGDGAAAQLVGHRLEPYEAAHPREQGGVVDGLRQEVVGARLEPRGDVGSFAARGQQDEESIAGSRHVPVFPAQIDARAAAQQPVRQDHVRRRLTAQPQRGVAVGRFDHAVPGAFQLDAHQAAMRAARPGIHEYELQAEVERVSEGPEHLPDGAQ